MANDDVIERLINRGMAAKVLIDPDGAVGWIHPWIDEVIAELRASRARIAELEQDARRLDWLLTKGVLDVRLSDDDWTCVETIADIDAAMAGGDEGDN